MDEAQARRIVSDHSDMILRISINYMKNRADAEDVCQTVFMKYLSKGPEFADEKHEKAWMIRTTINTCKDELRSSFFRRVIPLDSLPEEEGAQDEIEQEGIFAELGRLPENYRICLYLYYYEGYSVREIGELLHRREGTINAWLSRGRKKLRTLLDGDDFAEREAI